LIFLIVRSRALDRGRRRNRVRLVRRDDNRRAPRSTTPAEVMRENVWLDDAKARIEE
jgi:hypothetical protein